MTSLLQPALSTSAAGEVRARAWKHAVLLVAAVWCLYGSTLSYPFLFDDHPNISENEAIRTWSGISKMLAENGRPVAMLTFAANWAVSGKSVWSYHFVNLLIHCAAGLTLYGLVRRTLSLPGVSFAVPSLQHTEKDARDWPSSLALAVALLWLVHPLQTQAVTYIVQRMESLAALCFLLALYALVRSHQSTRAPRLQLLAVAACWLGMGCKQTMTACPLILLLFDRIFLAGSWRSVATRWWMHGGTFLSLGWLAWLTHVAVAGEEVASAGFGLRNITAWEYLCSQGGVLLHYLRLVVWPDVLCFDYVWPKATEPLAIWPQCAAVVLLLAASFWLLFTRPRIGLIAVSIFFILAPTSSIVPIADLAFEHRMYLPLAGLLTLLVLALFQLTARLGLPPRQLAALRMALAVGPALLLGGRTMLRNRDYASELGMWQLVSRQRPESARAFKNIASLHHRAGNREFAVEHYERAIRLDPTAYVTIVEYGNLYYAERDYPKALALFRQAAQAGPDQALPSLNVALVLSRMGQMREALAACDQALSRMKNPVSRQERKIRAWALATADDPALRNGKEALRLLKTLKPLPGKLEPDLLDRFAAAYAETGDFTLAAQHEERAIAAAQVQRAPKLVLQDFENRLALYRKRQPFRAPRLVK